MRLAWYNVVCDPKRFIVTMLGVAAAVFLMVFQASILTGFLHAASKIIDSTDADIWIVARGVECFEFPAVLERRFAEIARGVSGVSDVGRVNTGLVQFRKPDGNHQTVALIGADANVGRNFPIPRLSEDSGALDPNGLLVDESNKSLVQGRPLPLGVEISQRRAHVVGEISGYSSFLGTPYVFSSYRDSLQYLGLGPEQTTFILVRLASGAVPATVRADLKSRLPNVDVWTQDEFAQKARMYWISQTGAGGAILVAAFLGFLVGLAIISQAVYAATMEHIEEFATLKALGAANRFVIGVVLCEAAVCGLGGYLIGVLGAGPLVDAAAQSIPWLLTPWWIRLSAVPPTLLMCLLASIVSIRTALNVEPARVFRA